MLFRRHEVTFRASRSPMKRLPKFNDFSAIGKTFNFIARVLYLYTHTNMTIQFMHVTVLFIHVHAYKSYLWCGSWLVVAIRYSIIILVTGSKTKVTISNQSTIIQCY